MVKLTTHILVATLVVLQTTLGSSESLRLSENEIYAYQPLIVHGSVSGDTSDWKLHINGKFSLNLRNDLVNAESNESETKLYINLFHNPALNQYFFSEPGAYLIEILTGEDVLIFSDEVTVRELLHSDRNALHLLVSDSSLHALMGIRYTSESLEDLNEFNNINPNSPWEDIIDVTLAMAKFHKAKRTPPKDKKDVIDRIEIIKSLKHQLRPALASRLEGMPSVDQAKLAFIECCILNENYDDAQIVIDTLIDKRGGKILSQALKYNAELQQIINH